MDAENKIQSCIPLRISFLIESSKERGERSFFLPRTPEGMNESKQCLRRLRDEGMRKINFSGGEPFLHPKELAELCRFCKALLVAFIINCTAGLSNRFVLCHINKLASTINRGD